MALYPNGRATVYTNQVPYELDVLRCGLFTMTAVSLLARCVLGTGIGDVPLFVRLACTPIVPPSLAVTIGEGACYFLEPMDATAWSVVPADTDPNHNMFKQGWFSDPVNFSTPAPVTPGNSVIHLIQARFNEVDVNNVSRPYFNSADPSMPIFNNNFDTRQDTIDVQIKLGIEAPIPTPPTPDPGYVALYYVTVAYGQTSIVGGNITLVPGAPFITESLTQKISSGTVSGDFVSKVQEQQSTNISAVDIGTPNVIVLNPSPAYTSYSAITFIRARIANNNTGATTINISGLGAKVVKKQTSTGLAVLVSGDIKIGIHEFAYNTVDDSVQVLNPVPAPVVPPTIQLSYAIISFQDTTSQTIPATSSQVIAFDNTVSDPDNLIVGNGFIPTPGWWQFSCIIHQQVGYISLATSEFWIYKNGARLRSLAQGSATSPTNFSSSAKELANGTDAFTLVAVNNASAENLTIGGQALNNNASKLIRFEIQFVHA